MIDKEELFNAVKPCDDIHCKTCKFKLPPVEVIGERVERHTFGVCLIYDNKPQGVLWKGEKCGFYQPE